MSQYRNDLFHFRNKLDFEEKSFKDLIKDLTYEEVIYIDMDGVIVDFGYQVELVNNDPKISDSLKSSPDQIEGVFKNLPIKNSIESIIKLHNSELYDLFIATTAPWNNPGSFTDKRLWIERYLVIYSKRKCLLLIERHANWRLSNDDRLANGLVILKENY